MLFFSRIAHGTVLHSSPLHTLHKAERINFLNAPQWDEMSWDGERCDLFQYTFQHSPSHFIRHIRYICKIWLMTHASCIWTSSIHFMLTPIWPPRTIFLIIHAEIYMESIQTAGKPAQIDSDSVAVQTDDTLHSFFRIGDSCAFVCHSAIAAAAAAATD